MLDDFDHVEGRGAYFFRQGEFLNSQGIFHIINTQRVASAVRSRGATQRACLGSLAMARD